MAVTLNDLKQARDAARRCAYCASNLTLWGSIQGALLATGNHAIEKVRASGAEVFGDCVEAHALSRPAVTAEVRDFLLLATAGKSVSPDDVAGLRVSLWHDAATMISAGATGLFIEACPSEWTLGIKIDDFRPGELGFGDYLRRGLRQTAGEGLITAWRNVVAASAKWDTGNYEAIMAGVELEWGAAVAVLREQGGGDLIELTPEDVAILQYLGEQPGVARPQVDIAAGANLDRKTVSERLATLRKHGHVKRPEGKKRLDLITAAGISRMESIPENLQMAQNFPKISPH